MTGAGLRAESRWEWRSLDPKASENSNACYGARNPVMLPATGLVRAGDVTLSRLVYPLDKFLRTGTTIDLIENWI